MGRPIKVPLENVDRHLLATTVLRNYLQQTENSSCCPTGFLDCKSSSRIIKPGEWKSLVEEDIGCLREFSNVTESKSRQDLLDTRNVIKNYFKTELGQVDWYVRRT